MNVAGKFVDYVLSPQGQSVLASYGFIVPSGSAFVGQSSGVGQVAVASRESGRRLDW
jgi:hypothetical protein